MNDLNVTVAVRASLEVALKGLIKKISNVQVGTSEQFPYGWGTAGKGRSVWRILEELITQNLKKHGHEFGILNIRLPGSEVGVYDFEIHLEGFSNPIYVNIKSAVEGGRTNKDDISKARGLLKFYETNPTHELFIATVSLRFNVDMSVSLVNVSVVPTAWLPDIYVNPSNNANLQSSQYKNINNAIIRTNDEFVDELKRAIEVADQKKVRKTKLDELPL
ncbi:MULTISPECIES: hypothetical protein [Massilia]|jgi:hypothetical protein|uniref:Restriction endonuclease n=1 Tax=Massilia timonae CCUG 45783 TaxID=883126 RepID=K9DZM0_9BURK|nr:MULTISPECIES: hypothetical protein [Massilia]EKU82670.1 hypothetical protein HMPREF9710_02297 [Massilia timonae CCUG 45783]QYG03605.1 hypothetical protein KY496_09625 [Massilia sp. NP310]